MTTEQLTALVGAIIALLQVLTIAIGIWNKQHLTEVTNEQQRVAANLAEVHTNGKELKALLEKRDQA